MRPWRLLSSTPSAFTRSGISNLRVAGSTPKILCNGIDYPKKQYFRDIPLAARSISANNLEQRRRFCGNRVFRNRHDESRGNRATSLSAGKEVKDATAEANLEASSPSSRTDAVSSQPSRAPHIQSHGSDGPSTSSPDPPSSTAELPSESLSRRHDITMRIQTMSDRLMSSLSLASHRVNTLTGTDYSAIAALRDSITQQERDVKEGHEALSKARTAYSTALDTQAASQKEVVQLLERKHSWSATDLERYMSLIRSEHTNEQSVSAAREELERSEARLEAARQQVERAERKQYHEEQIWSDTIRRNSTWVTFGLMGLNILLLIVNVVMIEPWRRKRMVNEIRTALDEKTFTANVHAAGGSDRQSESVNATGEALEDLVDEIAARANEDGRADYPADTSFNDIHTASEPSADPFGKEEESRPRRFRDRIMGSVNSWFSNAWNWANYMLSEEHDVVLSRVDLTTALAESWAVGATCMLLLFVTVPIDLSDVFR